LQSSSFAMGDVVAPFAQTSMLLGLWAPSEPTHAGPPLLGNYVSMNLNAGIMTRYLRPRRPFKWFFGNTDHAWFAPRLAVTVQALRALRSMASARIGIIGGLAPTFFNLLCDERLVQQRIGTRYAEHEMAELLEQQALADAAEVAAVVAAMHQRAGGRVEVSARDMAVSARLYLGMRALARTHGYPALAVSDWPRLQDTLQIHPGLAFSWLNEVDGIPVAAEGDRLGATSMLMLDAISGKRSLLLDMIDVDLPAGAALMWHMGGSPLALAGPGGVAIKNHPTLGRKAPGGVRAGAIADFIFAPGPCTITRIAGDAQALVVVEGDIVAGPSAGFEGSRGWVTNFRINQQPVSLADLINTALVEGLEHHFVLATGHHGAALAEVAAWSGMKPVQSVPYSDAMQLPVST
jgi:L-fucose isomerase-like protein